MSAENETSDPTPDQMDKPLEEPSAETSAEINVSGDDNVSQSDVTSETVTDCQSVDEKTSNISFEAGDSSQVEEFTESENGNDTVNEAENEAENLSEDLSENVSEIISETVSGKESENTFENDSENDSENDIEDESEDGSEDGSEDESVNESENESETVNEIGNKTENANEASGDKLEHKRANQSVPKVTTERAAKRPFVPPMRGRRVPPGPRVAPFPQPPRNNRVQDVRKNVPFQKFNKSDRSDDGSVGYVSNWGYRSNLIDQDGHFQRATTDLKNYIAFYKAKYHYYFDLVNGRYPQFVRKFQNNLEIWRMSFNVYASGFSDYIAHLGEIHAFYQMELVNNELRWVYKDFNFYPNKMRYGFRVNSYDIADVHSRFIKFICLRDSIIKQFPYVNIKHRVFIFQKFDENLRMMMNRLNQVKLADIDISAENKDIVPSSSTTQENRQVEERQIERVTFPSRKERNVEVFSSFKPNFRDGPFNRRGSVSYSRPGRGRGYFRN